MKNIQCLSIVFLFIIGCSSAKKNFQVNETNNKETAKQTAEGKIHSKECESTKEYITAIEFLRDKSEMAAPEPEAQKMALEVAKGCNGSANRFIRIAKLLVRSHFTPKNAIDSANKFILKTDNEADAFVETFLQAFAKENLDMDVVGSAEIAHSLSNEFTGDVKVAASDFKSISLYCMNNKDILKLNKSECGRLAQRISKKGQNSNQSMAKSFEGLFEYLISKKGPRLNLDMAIKTTEEVLSVSAKAADNFIQGYKYAISTDGLKLNNPSAIEFAMKMAKFTETQAPVESAIKK